MKTSNLLTALTLALAATSAAQAAAPRAAKPAAEVLKDSPASDWRALDPDNTLLMDLT
ncbi:MAG: peptidylprolyl isomerase, partial [Burkholderiales bacterium]